MQQYFVKGSAISPVTIEDKETSKHMFQVMRLKEDDEVTLVFDDRIKRLARVLDVEARQFELVEELADNVELPVQVTIASGFPKGDKLEFITQKVTSSELAKSGPFLPTGRLPSGMARNWAKRLKN